MLPPPPNPPSGELLRRVHPQIWRACAGSPVQIPTVNSRVYYFPQGHLEQSSSSTSPPFLSSLALSKPSILCRISDVQLLANPVTDEVYTKLLLVPLDHPGSYVLGGAYAKTDRDFDDADDAKIVAFAKTLTPSDANNGGGFSVPRFCADSIFPPLNYQTDPPVQNLTITDIHGFTWEFRHIYRGTPRRHLLTTGWSKFVNHKKLIAGDSVVFMRNSKGAMFIGVRRAGRFNNNARWRDQVGGEAPKVVKDEGLFTRNVAGSATRSSEAVAEAVERAAQGVPFEVVYYPRAGWYSDFVVRAEMVDAAFSGFWSAGTRVKMAVETEESSRMTWFQGTIAAIVIPDSGPWQGSPWRMLQITWDDPEVLQHAKRVSPWQVEFIATALPVQVPYPPSKKLRYRENSGFLTDGEGELFFQMSGLTNSTMGNMNTALLNYNTFPAGMQGARQNYFPAFGLSNLLSANTPPMFTDTLFGNSMLPKYKSVPTEPIIGSSQSENLSPDSQSSLHSFGTELVGNCGENPKKVGITSIQLFGKTIHMHQPVVSGSEDVGSVEDDGSKVYNEVEGINNLLDLSLTSYTELLNRIDGPYERASADEAAHPEQVVA